MIMISIMEMEKQVKTLRNNSRNYLAPLFLRLRCPSCEKLYRMDTRDVKSSEPHFECLVCQSVFGFEYPTSSPLNVPTKLIRRSQARLEGKDLRPMDVKTCPKCAALNAKGSEECRQCGVIFARLNGLPLDSKMGALPSLVKAWQDLMSDYSNLTKHLHFVNRCEDLQAVPYALKKYQDLKEAQPQDQIAQEMLHRVLMRRFAVGAGLVKDHPSVQAVVHRINWLRLRKMAPWFISMALITVGLTQPDAKNLAGIGASILFITLGLHLFLKGHISISDFW